RASHRTALPGVSGYAKDSNFMTATPSFARMSLRVSTDGAARDSMGQMIKTIENELVATDDRTFRWSLKKSYPKILLALGKIGTPCCFVMPARIAATEPYKQINDYLGSSPIPILKVERTTGA